MKPHRYPPETADLFRARLDKQLNMKHPLISLAGLMDWERIERHFAGHFPSNRGRPALPPRLVAGLLYLQQPGDASDERVVNTWLENPYWQFFTGETYLQTELPIDPSSLTRWRQRLGREGVELLLAVTIEAARTAGLIQHNSADRVIMDTTVAPKPLPTQRTVAFCALFLGVFMEGVGSPIWGSSIPIQKIDRVSGIVQNGLVRHRKINGLRKTALQRKPAASAKNHVQTKG